MSHHITGFAPQLSARWRGCAFRTAARLRRWVAATNLGCALLLGLLLTSGCAMQSDVKSLEHQVSRLLEQQTVVLAQLSGASDTQQRISAMDHALEELQWQQLSEPVHTDEMLNLLAENRHWTESRLTDMQRALNHLTTRVTDIETARPLVAPTPPIRPNAVAAPAPSAPPPSQPALRSDAPAPLVATAPDSHMVQSGDTLGTIALAYLGSPSRWQEILVANPQLDNPDLIRVGQVLMLPQDAPITPAEETPPPNATPETPQPLVNWPPASDTEIVTMPQQPDMVYHIVRPGDTLGSIAASYLGDENLWERVWEANPQLDHPDWLQAGLALRVPITLGQADPPPLTTPQTDTPVVADSQPTPALASPLEAPVMPEPAPDEQQVKRQQIDVLEGDTLGTIAQRHLGDNARWRELLLANPQLANPDLIFPGTRLSLPVLDNGHTAHTVGAQETLGTIATQYFDDPSFWEVIWRANPQLENPDLLIPGQVLRIPLTSIKP